VRTMYPTNTVQSIILLFMSLLVSAVTTFGAFDWLKDAFDYEHCGSDWIKPDINGNYNTASIEITTTEQKEYSDTTVNLWSPSVPIVSISLNSSVRLLGRVLIHAAVTVVLRYSIGYHECRCQ